MYQSLREREAREKEKKDRKKEGEKERRREQRVKEDIRKKRERKKEKNQLRLKKAGAKCYFTDVSSVYFAFLLFFPRQKEASFARRHHALRAGAPGGGLWCLCSVRPQHRLPSTSGETRRRPEEKGKASDAKETRRKRKRQTRDPDGDSKAKRLMRG